MNLFVGRAQFHFQFTLVAVEKSLSIKPCELAEDTGSLRPANSRKLEKMNPNGLQNVG